MTSDKLRKLLESQQAKFEPELYETGNEKDNQTYQYQDGYMHAVDLLWPLVETLKEYAERDHSSCIEARIVLAELEQKLKGES